MRFSRNRVYLTSCRKCGGTTSKSYAKHHDSLCKACVEGNVGVIHSGPKCPDCGGPIAAWKLRKGYHCDNCTREADPVGYYNETRFSYEEGY